MKKIYLILSSLIMLFSLDVPQVRALEIRKDEVSPEICTVEKLALNTKDPEPVVSLTENKSKLNLGKGKTLFNSAPLQEVKVEVPKDDGTLAFPVPKDTCFRDYHYNGIDCPIPVGTEVKASGAGTVVLAKGSGWNMGYGKYVIVDHGYGWQTLYGHLSRVSVTDGQKVEKGEIIGLSGNTGNSLGPHLHFETRRGEGRRNRSNPFSILGHNPAQVALK